MKLSLKITILKMKFLGFRPEHISIKNDSEIKINVKTDLIENLGFEKIVYTSFNGSEIRIKTSSNVSKELKEISIPKDKIYLFDKNKKRIRI